MIVKFARRGKGGGSGPVDYLLGKDRNREGATLNRGNPEQIKSLIDSSPYAKKYTTGYLSFSEENLPTETKNRLMSEFQEALLPGLNPDQYSILWVEHIDKGRLELNFVVPNVELQTGKRLQPYFHAADKKRIDSWKRIKNIELKLHDPDDPENRQPLKYASDIPKDIKNISDLITDGLHQMMQNGTIKNRQNIISTLESRGFEIARITKSSISIKNPDEDKKRNIRLTGEIYEQDFEFSEKFLERSERAIAGYRETTSNRLSELRATYSRCFEHKREANIKRYKHPEPALEPFSTQDMGLVASDCYFGLDELMGRDLDRGTNDLQPNTRINPNSSQRRGAKEQGRKYPSEQVRRTDLHSSSRGQRQLDEKQRRQTDVYTGGVLENDGIRAAIIERIRAATERAGRTAKRVCEAIQRFSEAIHTEPAGQLTANEQCQQLNRAGEQLSRAIPTITKAIQHERAIERQHENDRDLGMWR